MSRLSVLIVLVLAACAPAQPPPAAAPVPVREHHREHKAPADAVVTEAPPCVHETGGAVVISRDVSCK